MKNYFSTAVIATAIALFVPNNGAEAVGHFSGTSARSASLPGASVTQVALPQQAAAGDLGGDQNPSFAWIIGLGFAAFVATRRLRGD